MSADALFLNITQMIDMAIGSPEIVDFGMLQAVLHVIAQQLHVGQKNVQLRGTGHPAVHVPPIVVSVQEFEVSGSEGQEKYVPLATEIPQGPETLLIVERVARRRSPDNESPRRGEVRFDASNIASGGGSHGIADDDSYSDMGSTSVVTMSKFKSLEKAVDKLKTTVYGGQPRNSELIQDVRTNPGSKSITDMWASMNIHSRVETLESGLEKLSSLVQDLAAEYRGGGLSGPGFGGGAPSCDVMWENIQKIMTVMKQQFGDNIFSKGGAGAAGAFIGPDGKPMSMKEKIEMLEKMMKNCCDKVEKLNGVVNDQLNSFQDQLVGLGDDLASMNESAQLSSDLTSFADLARVVRELQEEMRNVRRVAAALAQEKEERGHNLNVLLEQVELLKTIKMDREDLAEAMAEKADLRLLARKVSHDQFEMACDDLSRGLDNAMAKLNTQEALWQQALDDIQREIENKLDKLELGPVKDFFMSKLKQLQENLRQMAALRREAEAAGTKKKFLRDVNCISCDARAIMATTEESAAVMKPMPAHLSMKPYLTYELDQMRRRQQTSPPQRNMLDWEKIKKDTKQPVSPVRVRSETGKHLCTRYCGGSHTVTTPAQRVARTGHFLKQWGPDVMALPPTKEPERPVDKNEKAVECKCIDG